MNVLEDMEYQIFAIGDSITYGKKDTFGGWVDRLKINLLDLGSKNSQFSTMIYNLGISGDTSDSLLSRFTSEVLIRQQFYSDRQAIVIIAFGANDCGFDSQKNDFAVSLNKYRQNILDTVELAKQNEILTVLINITPVLSSIENKVDKYGKSRSNDFVNKFNLELDKISQTNNLLLVDANSEFLNSEFSLDKLLDVDGLHPSDLGHKLICEKVLEELNSKLFVR